MKNALPVNSFSLDEVCAELRAVVGDRAKAAAKAAKLESARNAGNELVRQMREKVAA